jgi:HlyD family secretion protein
MDTNKPHDAFRNTTATDIRVAPAGRNLKPFIVAVAAVAVLALLASLIWPMLRAGSGIKASELRFGKAESGFFSADASGYATVVAARAPTLYAAAAGSVRQEQSALDAARAEADRQGVANQRAILEKQRALDDARIAQTAAKRERTRADRAFELKAISEVDFLRAQDALAAADIQVAHGEKDVLLERSALALELRQRQSLVAQQNARVQALQVQAHALQMRAPFAGLVGALAASERAQLAQDAPVLALVDLGALELSLSLSEIYGAQLKAGLGAAVDYEGNTLRGEVRSVAAEVSGGQIALRIRLQDPLPAGLKQNQKLLARVEFERREQALSIARGAYLDELAGRAIWVRVGDRIERRSLEIGAIGAERVEVLRGLQAGDSVVLSSVKAEPNQTEIVLF